MLKRITLTQVAFRNLIQELTRNPGRAVVCSAGVSRFEDEITLLAGNPGGASVSVDPALHCILACSATGEDLLRVLRREISRHRELNPAAAIGFGLGVRTGEAVGFMLMQGRTEPLDELVIVDAGMPRVRFPSTVSTTPPTRFLEPEVLAPNDRETWSRTIGALGENVWRCLTDLHYAVVGCGRSDSREDRTTEPRCSLRRHVNRVRRSVEARTV